MFKIDVVAVFWNSIEIVSAKDREDRELGIGQRMIKQPVKVETSQTIQPVKLGPARRWVVRNLLLLSLQCNTGK